MYGFTKLWSDIVLSTVWREPDHVRLVWITMLALSDAKGYVGTSVPGLADLAHVPIDKCRDAIERLSSPDPDSRSKAHEGRRVTEADRGFLILNYEEQRNRVASAHRKEQVREAVRRFRTKHEAPRCPSGNQSPESVIIGKPIHIHKQKQKQEKDIYTAEFEEFWTAYPKRAGDNPRKAAERVYGDRRRDGVSAEMLLAAVKRYAASATADGSVGTKFVKQARYWLSPADDRWNEPFDLPTPVVPRLTSEQITMGRAAWPDDTKWLEELRQMEQLPR